MTNGLDELQKALEAKLDRLAEDCHDAIISRQGMVSSIKTGWAKTLQPVIWMWFEREIQPILMKLFQDEQAKVSVFRQSLEGMAVSGETIRFAIETFNKECEWQKKHEMQDMKFIPLKQVFAGDFAEPKKEKQK